MNGIQNKTAMTQSELRAAVNATWHQRQLEHYGITRELSEHEVVSMRERYWSGEVDRYELNKESGLGLRAVLAIVWGVIYRKYGGQVGRKPPHRRRSLTDDQVRDIRVAYHETKERLEDIGIRYGKSAATIRSVGLGETHRAVRGPQHLEATLGLSRWERHTLVWSLKKQGKDAESNGAHPSETVEKSQAIEIAQRPQAMGERQTLIPAPPAEPSPLSHQNGRVVAHIESEGAGHKLMVGTFKTFSGKFASFDGIPDAIVDTLLELGRPATTDELAFLNPDKLSADAIRRATFVDDRLILGSQGIWSLREFQRGVKPKTPRPRSTPTVPASRKRTPTRTKEQSKRSIQRLVAIRKIKRLGIAETAKLVGISKDSVWSLENGESVPTDAILRRYALAFDKPLEWFHPSGRGRQRTTSVSDNMNGRTPSPTPSPVDKAVQTPPPRTQEADEKVVEPDPIGQAVAVQVNALLETVNPAREDHAFGPPGKNEVHNIINRLQFLLRSADSLSSGEEKYRRQAWQLVGEVTKNVVESWHRVANRRAYEEATQALVNRINTAIDDFAGFVRSHHEGGAFYLEPEIFEQTLDGPVDLTERGSFIQDTSAHSNSDVNVYYDLALYVVELNDLVASHNIAFAEDQRYPVELQPRDRGRDEMRDQVTEIARHMNPSMLLEDTGALHEGIPIVGSDGYVESGNGRVMALMLAELQFRASWESYQEALAEILGRDTRFGFSLSDSRVAEILNERARPVLVRVRSPETDILQRRAFTDDAGEGTVAAFSISERAEQDAKRISFEELADFADAGPKTGTLEDAILSYENAAIVAKFIGRIPSAQRGALRQHNKDEISRQGIERLSAALFAKVFSSEAGSRMLARHYELTEDEGKNVTTALFRSLPRIIRAEALVKTGERDSGLSFAIDIIAAVEKYFEIRKAGESVDMYLYQAGLYAGAKPTTPEQDTIIKHIYTHRKSVTRLAGLFADYSESVVNMPHINQSTMFRESPPDKAGILMETAERIRRESEAEYDQLDSRGTSLAHVR